MKHFDAKKAKKKIIGDIQRANFYKDFDMAEDGRIVFFTSLFFHSDLSIWDHPEEDSDEDNEEIVEEVISLSQLGQLAQFETEMAQQTSQDENTQQGDS